MDYLLGMRVEFLLVDDNCRPLRARIVRAHLQQHGIECINPWPAKSHDRKCFEHCWAWLKYRLNKRIIADDTLQDMVRYAREEWRRIPQRYMQTLIRSMHYREEIRITQQS